MGQNTFSLRLIQKTLLTHDVYELVYAGENIPAIEAGQFLLCDCDATNPRLRRSYSVSWVSGDQISFIVKRIPDGKGGSIALCDQEIGHEMQVWGPMGHFVLRDTPFPKVFIGTGTGFAPLYFQLRKSLERHPECTTFFLFGVRELRDVFYLDQLQKWSQDNAHFDFEIYCSRESSLLPEKHHHGRVTDYLKDFIQAPLSRGVAESRGVLDLNVQPHFGTGVGKGKYYTGDFAHIPYNPELVNYAREQRQTESLAEKRMWYDILKEKKINQYKFTRQKPLLNYIADFYCSELGLIIEVDGDNHENQKEYDLKRTEELESYGLKVLRFHNLQSMEEVPAVEKEILEWIEKRKMQLFNPSPRPSALPLTGELSNQFITHETEFYICGSPAMVTEVRHILEHAGIAKEKVFFEQY